MENMISISNPDLLHINDDNIIWYGADQSWYTDSRKRHSGCGPTVCSNLMWYFSKTRETCHSLCPGQGNGREDILRLMEEIWHYVTPGSMGVHSTSLFADGAIRYGTEHGVSLTAHVLDIEKSQSSRPQYATVERFFRNAYKNDLPIAFLNLSNGKLQNLEAWHWVTLIALEEGGIRMYDQGLSQQIDLELWLRTTILGGGFVALEPVSTV